MQYAFFQDEMSSFYMSVGSQLRLINTRASMALLNTAIYFSNTKPEPCKALGHTSWYYHTSIHDNTTHVTYSNYAFGCNAGLPC